MSQVFSGPKTLEQVTPPRLKAVGYTSKVRNLM
jgi:hypothetical protein